MKGFTFGDDSPFSSFLAQGQTDLEFLVEKILNRSDPEARQIWPRPIRLTRGDCEAIIQ